MGEWLTYEKATHRDEKGNLVPIVVPLEFQPNKPQIKVMPISKSKWDKLKIEKETRSRDELIIIDHCVYPKFTAKQLEDMSVKMISEIVYAIISESIGKSQSQLKDAETIQLEIQKQALSKKE